MLSQKSILKKTIQVSLSILASRVLGILRESLMSHYLGAGMVSDAFITAFKLPNYIRKIFADGALSTALVPLMAKRIGKKGKPSIAGIMTLSLLIFESIALCIFISTLLFPFKTIYFFAPGFSHEQVTHTITFLRILTPLIFFLSSSALFAGALQSVGHFFVPAISSVLFNLVFIIGLLISWHYHLPVTTVCWFILAGGACMFFAHLAAYLKLHFLFSWWTRFDMHQVKNILLTFVSCFLSMGMMEMNFIIDSQFVSFLPAGTITMLYYANRFIGIPIGVFAVAFSTILLPHFSRVSVYAPKRLRYYLHESTKFILFISIPIMFCMAFFAERIFYTIYLSDKFTSQQVLQTAHILYAYIIGLTAFTINKILLNVYYALDDIRTPTVVSCITISINILLNYSIIYYLHAPGLALTTSISALIQMVIYLIMLNKKHAIHLFWADLITFLWRYSLQLMLILPLFYGCYQSICALFANNLLPYAGFFLDSIGLWFWVMPLIGILMATLYLTRNWFNVYLYFLR